MLALIYGLCDPRTQQCRYIGQSVKGLSRPRQHRLASNLKDSSHKNNWIKQLKAAGLTYYVKVLEIVEDPATLNDVESFWIAQARGLGWPLTNVCPGGGTTRGTKHSPEARKKMSEAGRGVPKTPEHVAKVAAAHRGMKRSREARLRISRSRGGTSITDQRGRVFESASSAARELGLRPGNISSVLAGKLHTTGGRTFSRVAQELI